MSNDPGKVSHDRFVAGIGRHKPDIDVRKGVGATRGMRPDEPHRDDALVRPADLHQPIEPRLDLTLHAEVARSRGSTSVAIRSNVATWLGSGG